MINRRAAKRVDVKKNEDVVRISEKGVRVPRGEILAEMTRE